MLFDKKPITGGRGGNPYQLETNPAIFSFLSKAIYTLM